MSPVELFKAVTGKGSYIVGYILDGWTNEIYIQARSPNEAMMITQDRIGSICNVTFVERND